MGNRTKINKLVIKDYNKLIKEVSELNGIIYHYKSIQNAYLRQTDLRKKSIDNELFLGSHFLYYSPINGKLIFGDFYKVNIKNYSSKTQLISRKVINFFVALAYESFENFLRSITARIIINNKTKAIEIDQRLGFSSYKSCFLYLQSNFRNNSEIVSLLRKICPDLDKSIKKEKGLRNFLNFYRVYSKCRNHIIHSNDLISLSKLEKSEMIDVKFAERYFGTTKTKRNNAIIDTTETYHETLQTIVSFAYLIINSFDSSFLK